MIPGAWAAKAHLYYLLASPKYQVVAVCNSTAKSSQASIDYHPLGPDVKAYGTAEDISNDPNVDLSVVSVKVGMHYKLTKPALLAGKDVFVEWPLGASTLEAEELTQLAQAKNVKTIVGLQARASPFVTKIKESVQSGKIGKVLSSTVVTTFSGLPTGIWPSGADFTHVLGTFSELKSTLKTEYKTIDVIDIATGKVVTANHPKTSPDHIVVQGNLSFGAVVSIVYYTTTGQSINTAGNRWIIGTEGQIEITTPAAQWQMEASGVNVKVKVGDKET